MNWVLLQNSLLVSALATLLATGFGLVVALWLAGLEARWRNGLLMLAVMALALPPFLVTNCWLHLLGHTGIWRGWLPLNIYSLGGTIWILALLLWPITTFATLAAWQRLQPAHFEADAQLAGGKLIHWLLLPMARAALGQAAVLTIVLTLNHFAVPAILQTKVFPAEIWVSFNTTFDYLAAIRLSWPLVLAPLLLLIWMNRREIAWPRLAAPTSPRIFRRQLGNGWFGMCGVGSLIVLFLSVGLPVVQLFTATHTWSEFAKAFSAGRTACLNSFLLAALTATLTVGLGLATWRWRIGVFLWLPFLVPGVLLGIALIVLLNRPPLTAFYQSAGIVILAWSLRYLAIGWNGAARARRSVDPILTDAARLDGANRWQLFRHVHWPQLAPQLAAAWYVVYLLCLWDVETLVLVVPPSGETLALRVFNLLHYGHNSQVNALCLLLLALAALPLAGWLVARGCGIARKSSPLFALLGACFAFTGCTPQLPSNELALESQLFDRVQVIGSRGTGLGQFNKPRSVAVDAQDNLYVADMTGRVQKFSPQGEFLLSWQMPQTDLGRPKGMCRDAAGNIVVIEPHYSRVNHFSTDGKLVRQWGEVGTNAGQVFFPRSAAVNSKGEIYVTEYGLTERIQRFTAQGKSFLNIFGVPGDRAGEFNRAEGIGIGPQDQVFVADSCNHRIQIFSREGKYLRTYGRAGRAQGDLSYPCDVRVDAAGCQYVCEFGNSRIQIFDKQDRPLELLGGAGSAPGQFSNPWGITLDSVGNLYVADSMNHRVQKFLRKVAPADLRAVVLLHGSK